MAPRPTELTAIYPNLANRVVLVTGGGMGIGAAIVRHFVHQRSRVAFLDVDEAAAQELIADIAADIADVDGATSPLFLACDVRDIAALRTAIQDIAATLGLITVLVNNAANDDRHDLDTVEPEYFDDRIAVNLRHYYFAIQAVRDGMAKSGGGSIINLGSIAWRLNLPDISCYATAKAGIAGMTNVLAAELGPQRIRVNCIEPGVVATKRQRELWLTPEYVAQVRAGQCLPDLTEPEMVADLALFLASDASLMCTSQTFTIDAGWT